MPKITVKTECGACGGTGLYCGFAEPKGTAVVCLRCDGTGCANIEYTPFERRKAKRGVHTVQRSRGSFIGTGVGPAGRSITYAAFERGEKP
jgi:hypothetical protein